MPHGGDSWRPAPERYGVGSKKSSIAKDRTEQETDNNKSNDGFWRRDQRDEEYGSGNIEQTKRKSSHQENPNSPLQQDPNVPLPRKRSTSFSGTDKQQHSSQAPLRPTLQIRHASQSSQQLVTSPTTVGPIGGTKSQFEDRQYSPSSSTMNSTTRSDLMASKDPRLRNRELGGTTSQGNVTVSQTAAIDQNITAEWNILKSLSTLEAERIRIESDYVASDKKCAALKNELQSLRFQSNNAYSQQITEQVHSTEAEKTSLSSKIAANVKRHQELQSSFVEISQSRENALAARLTESYEASLSQKQQGDNDVITQQKSFVTQLDSQMKALEKVQTQVRDQAVLIEQLQQQNKELKKLAMSSKPTSPTPSLKELHLSGLQKLLDPLQTSVKEQKLAIAKLNDIFAPLTSVRELQTRMTEIEQQPALSTSKTGAPYMTREEMKPYIENFNRYSEVVDNNLGVLKSRFDAIDSQQQASMKVGEATKNNIGSLGDRLKSLELKSQAQINVLSAEDKEKLRQALALRKDLAEFQNRTNHSIKSLSERWNSIRTEELARRILATLNPTLNKFLPHINQLRQQLQQLEPVKADLASYKEKTDHHITELDTQFSNLSDKSTQIQDGLRDVRAAQPVVTNRLGMLETETQTITQHVDQVRNERTIAESAIQDTLRELQTGQDELRSNVDQFRDDFRSDHSKLAEQFREARDSVVGRVEALENRRKPKLTNFLELPQHEHLNTVTNDAHENSPSLSSVSSRKKSDKAESNRKNTALQDTKSRTDDAPKSSEADVIGRSGSPQKKSKGPTGQMTEDPGTRKLMKHIFRPAAKSGENSPRTLGGTPVKYSSDPRFNVIEITETDDEVNNGGESDNNDRPAHRDDTTSLPTSRGKSIDIMDPKNWRKEALSTLQSSNVSERESPDLTDDTQTLSTIEVAPVKRKRKRDRSREESSSRKRRENKINSSQSDGKRKKKKQKTNI